MTGGGHELQLQEEVLLLALEDRKGTPMGNMVQYALGGAVLAELVLRERVHVTSSARGKPRIESVQGAGGTGSEVLDDALGRILKQKKPRSPTDWVMMLGGVKDLRHRVARSLCRRGILRADEGKLLLIFTRKVYPTLDQGTERELIERMRRAIFDDDKSVTPRTALAVSLAYRTSLLQPVFGKKEIKARKARIEELEARHPVGRATKEAIDAVLGAVMTAAAAT